MSFDQRDVEAALPGYDIGGELGRGGWGVVLAGRHRTLGRDVAIKKLPSAFAADPAVQQRFAAEARTLAGLDHPHIVPIFDYVERDGLCLLVMERLAGGTLWDRFVSAGVTMTEACATTLAVASALQCAHEQGVLHRDIKPENMMFTDTGALKVTDFGIAKVVGGAETMATRAGEVLGTPAYMAPEQASGGALGPATDVYALATMLYELLAGDLPFPDVEDPLAVLYQHVHEDPRPLVEAAPQVPAPLADAVSRGLAKDPVERGSVVDFGVAVASAATEAWGAGWLGASAVPVMATGALLTATEAPAQVAVGAGTIAPTGIPEGPRTLPPSGPPAPPPPTEPPVRVHAAAPRPSVVVDVDRADLELVPVRELRLDAPVRPPALIAVGLLVLAVAIAVVGLGSVDRQVDVPEGAIMIDGQDVTDVGALDIDLSRPVEVAVSDGRATEVELAFFLVDVPLGSRSAPVVDGVARVDASGLQYVVAGRVDTEITIRAGHEARARVERAADAAQRAILSLPGAAAVAALLFCGAYAESLLRSMRRGRRRISGVVGLAVVGALGGAALVLGAWVLGGTTPTSTTALVTAALGAAAGVAASRAARRSHLARRARRARPASEAR